MKSSDAKLRFAVDHALRTNPELFEKFLAEPGGVLAELEASEDALGCPPEAHDALKRGEDAAAAVAALGDEEIIRALPKAVESIRKHLGSDAVIEKQPFGIRFAERVRTVAGFDWTATASGTITFSGWDKDADVDD